MRYATVRAALVVSLLAGPAAAAQSEPATTPELAALEQRAFSGKASDLCPAGDQMRVYPIGFSPERDRYAQLVFTKEGDKGLWRLVIVETQTDKAFTRVSYEAPDGKHDLATFIDANELEFQAALRNFEIEIAEGLAVHQFPWDRHGEEVFEATLKDYPEPERGLFGRRKKKVKPEGKELKLISKRQGTKVVGRYPLDKGGKCCELLGFVPGPKERTVALMLLRGSKDFDGQEACEVAVVATQILTGYHPHKK